MTTNKMVGRYERVQPLTKTYWAIMIFGSLLCILCIATSFYYLIKYKEFGWTAQMAFFSVMWMVFAVSESLRFLLKQRHTLRVLCLGYAICAINISSYVVVRTFEASLRAKANKE